MSNITAIVNIYKRPHVLDEQIQAILAQTIKPECIFIWNNGNSEINLDKYKNMENIRVFDNNYNYGVWSRFLIGFLAPTDYICIFDDDTIPGNRWFENCLQSMSQKEALYGTIGVIFDNTPDKYVVYWRHGWDGPEDITKAVDIVGHSWFFKREWLKYFVKEDPQVYSKKRNGEDMHFSFMMQKYANIQTCVPPHPKSDRSLWGSIPKTAWKYGCDGTSETIHGMHEMFSEYISRGFRRIIPRTMATSETDLPYFLQMIKENKPFAIIRPADGEYLVMQDRTLTNIDDWTFVSGGTLKNTLKDAITLASNKSCYIGVPCPCCNMEIAKWYIDNFNINPIYLTFANIFCNKNWKQWSDFVKNGLKFVFVGPVNNSNLAIEQFIHIHERLVNNWDSEGEQCVKLILDEIKTQKGRIYMFSCGPIAKIIISRAWNEHPYNIYIDAGSSLDLYTKGYTNRDYANNNPTYSERICKFDANFIKLIPEGGRLWGSMND
jgi:hypothetical protein